MTKTAPSKAAPGKNDDSNKADPEQARARLAATGRNDSCPCGSGKKYKKCHGVNAAAS